MTLVVGGPDAATTSALLIELGLLVLSLAVLARMAHRIGLSPIPLYLVAGLVASDGGPLRLRLSREFVELGAEVGLVLLLLALGLQYSASELRAGLRTGRGAAGVDLAANFTPGLAMGLLLGWQPTAALLLGGVTYISSSGVVAKVLSDLGRVGNRETPTVLTILVIEDLVMAAYLPLMAVLVARPGLTAAAVGLTVALTMVSLAMVVALRHGATISRWIRSPSDEVLLLSVLGITLAVAGLAQQLQVSAAVGAFLVGVAISGPVSSRAAQLIGPLRDLFAATFFFFFGVVVDLAALPAVLWVAVVLAVVTGATKVATGWWSATRAGVGRRGALRAGTVLIARGEFSVVIAEIGVVAGVNPALGPIAVAYVLLLAFAGPIITRVVDRSERQPASWQDDL
ncbi:cation:proton antiporter [soil metagenome]